jgi:hypothetical protein
MKLFLIIISSFLLTLSSFGQEASQDSCFTNRFEAKNLTVNGLKEGKWVIYEHLIPAHGEVIDTGAAYYILTVYRNGKPVGIEREYYMKTNKLRRETIFTGNGAITKNYKESEIK